MSWKVLQPCEVNGQRKWYHIDTVWFTSQCDADYVKRSLINHDGYPADIEVQKV